MSIRWRHLLAAIKAGKELVSIPNGAVISALIINCSLVNIPAATTERPLARNQYIQKNLRKRPQGSWL